MPASSSCQREYLVAEPGKMIQRGRFNAMDEFAGFALGGNEIEPAAGQHLLGGKVGNSFCQDVLPAKVVQQPSVEALVANGGLNCLNVSHGGTHTTKFVRIPVALRGCRLDNSIRTATVTPNTIYQLPEAPEDGTARNWRQFSPQPLLVAWTCGMDNKRLPYPVSKVEPVADIVHGERVPDPYRWLEEGDNPAVREWTEKQNALTRAFWIRFPAAKNFALGSTNFLEIGLMGVPKPAKGKVLLHQTRRQTKSTGPLCSQWRHWPGSSLTRCQQTLGRRHHGVGLVLPLRRWKTGGVWHIVVRQRSFNIENSRCRDRAKTSKMSSNGPALVPWCGCPTVAGSITRVIQLPGSVPAAEETYHRHVYLHKLGDNPARDLKVFGVGRAKEDWPNLQLSPDGRWLVVVVQQGWAKTEVYIADTTKMPHAFRTLVDKVPAIYQVDLNNDTVFIRTNERAPRYKLFAADIMKLDRPAWREVLAEGTDVLEQVTLVGDTLADGVHAKRLIAIAAL